MAAVDTAKPLFAICLCLLVGALALFSVDRG